jgi:hypothetical protein
VEETGKPLRLSEFGVPLCIALCLFLPNLGYGALELKPSGTGVAFEAGDMGSFTVNYPWIAAGDREEAPSEVRVDGPTAHIRYPGGARLEVACTRDGFDLSFAELPAGIDRYSVEMLINFNYRSGSWTIGDVTKDFPRDKPGKPHLFQGNAGTFILKNFEGKALVFEVPPRTFQQLSDNREWNWQIFNWKNFVSLDRANPTGSFKITLDLTGAKRVILMDRFGQNARRDFPGKLANEGELASDRLSETAYLDSFPRSDRDRFGGLADPPKGLQLHKTGYFHVERRKSGWVLVDPDGNPFFQLGLCGLGPGEDYTYITGREGVFEWIPERTGRFSPAWHPEQWWSDKAFSFYIANVIRKYGTWDPEANVLRMISRVRAFGFNSSGAWSYVSGGTKVAHWPYTPFLPLGRWDLGIEMIPGVGGVLDPFDEPARKMVNDAFARDIAPNAADPLIIGYFLGNEQDFENIPRAIPALDGKYACKRRLVKMLKDKYKNVSAFNRAWNTSAGSFDTLADAGIPVITPAAEKDMDAYYELFLSEYYSLVRDTFRKYDKNHMLIGNRWRPDTAKSDILCKVAGNYLDIVSVNYYTQAIDRPFMDRVYRACGERPILWSEFHFTCEPESGLSGRRDIATQEVRGLGYRNYVEAAASLGYVVGIQWFTLVDQPVTGRYFEHYSGEDFNIGLFSVVDRPYRPLIAEMAVTNRRIYGVWLGETPPFVYDHPLFNPKPGGK